MHKRQPARHQPFLSSGRSGRPVLLIGNALLRSGVALWSRSVKEKDVTNIQSSQNLDEDIKLLLRSALLAGWLASVLLGRGGE